MSASDDKKAKRRKNRRSAVAKSKGMNTTCQSKTSSVCPQTQPALDMKAPTIDAETLKQIERLMDAPEDEDITIPIFPKGPNPFIGKERCLLCGCERIDPPNSLSMRQQNLDNADSGDRIADFNLSQIPLWVCPDCRKSTDQETEDRAISSSIMEQDLPPEPSSLPYLPDPTLEAFGETTLPNGNACNCEACTERREIEAEHDRETQELQTCWTVLRNLVRTLYSRDKKHENKPHSDCDEDIVLPTGEEEAKELVHRLCARDPHQLFLRLESQVRDFVIEIKKRLLKQLQPGCKTPQEAKAFISLLLEEYGHLCKVSSKMAEILTELKKEHLSRFKVTWELHNKHLFQSIAYTEPSIQSSLHLIIQHLRMGAASKESYNEDIYPNLLYRYLKFDDEMSVISVVWRDSQQLIEQFNEEQNALKLKQKMLKEDWEFFKAQRKLLEQQVSKTDKAQSNHSSSSSSSFEAQFTETMRQMLQGSKPSPEECHCSRCNRKRCPCDECTITHMITCGIISPETLEATTATNHVNFLHDPNRYKIDVSPPSMSSTTSSSCSTSPVPMESEKIILPFDDCQDQLNSLKALEEIRDDINGSQSPENDENDCDGDDDEDDDDDDEYDVDEEDEDDEEEEEDIDDDRDCKIIEEIDSEFPDGLHDLPNHTNWLADSDDGAAELISSETCDCYHCVAQAQQEQQFKTEESLCQCYVCLRQRGKAVSTSLPQQMPTIPPAKPGELYPHIHGSGLHALPKSHMRPLLEPQLYNLHLPSMRQPKSIINPKLPLDFDPTESIANAYGDWDNTYDARVLLPKYGTGLSTELLPPPPLSTLTNPFASNFLTEPNTMSAFSCMDGSYNTTITSASSTRSMPFSSHTLPTTVGQLVKRLPSFLEPSMEPALDPTAVSTASNSVVSSKREVTPPCSRPATLGGNIQQGIQHSSQKVLPMPTLPTSDKPHSQHCKRHNVGKALPQTPVHSTSNMSVSSSASSLPVRTQDICQSAKDGGKKGASHRFPNHASVASSVASAGLGCNMQNALDHNHSPNCHYPVSIPSAGHNSSNVSVGTSTGCVKNSSEVDDGCDSTSDSSEQSSTTSGSNQKEGKYCDCCYCEFFGHGNPPVAPVSKNYPEMRDRLRLQLKKKKQKTDTKIEYSKEGCVKAQANTVHQEPTPVVSSTPVTVSSNVEDDINALLQYINGASEDKKTNGNSDKPTNAKAAKRARQKQRKAEEKARQELEEKLHEEQERLRQEAELEERRKQEEERLEKERALQKKKKKKKGAEKEDLANCSQSNERVPPVGREDSKQAEKPLHDSTKVKESAFNNNSKSAKESIAPKPAKGKTKEEMQHEVSNNKTVKMEPHSKRQSCHQEAKKESLSPVSATPTPLPKVDRKEETVNTPSPQNTPRSAKKAGQGHSITANMQPPSKKDSAKNTDNSHPSKANQNLFNGRPEPLQPQNRKTQVQQQQHPHQQQYLLLNHQHQHMQQQQCMSSFSKDHQNGSIPKQSCQRLDNKSSATLNKNPHHLLNAGSKLQPAKFGGQNGLVMPDMKQILHVPDLKKPPNPNGVIPNARLKQNGKVDSPHVMQEDFSPPNDQNKNASKNKRNKKKNRNSEDLSIIDEIFLPKSESDLENGEMDDAEKELEEFKRFCFKTPVKREKLQINMNIKDIFVKKKSGLGCS